MINHSKIDLRMGDGWNWRRIIPNSVSGNSGSATECPYYRVPSAWQSLQNVRTASEFLNGKTFTLRDTIK
jgi:hypothetical protein